MNKAEDSLFLLGGYDLEMLTIRNLLESRKADYADRRLNWQNAVASSYRKEISEAERQRRTVYGIELREDMSLPSVYRRIDHHNDLSHLPSALEQVAEILDFPMDRHMQLVVANDRAYIPGMLQIGAAPEEIERIRRADRKAQGVTEEDERLAEKAIAENREDVGDLYIVRAFNSRFSPVCDRLFPYRRLLVYTDSEWVYYGEKALQVAALFEKEIGEGKMFCGGGESGYVGTSQNRYSQKELMEMIDRIKRL